MRTTKLCKDCKQYISYYEWTELDMIEREECALGKKPKKGKCESFEYKVHS